MNNDSRVVDTQMMVYCTYPVVSTPQAQPNRSYVGNRGHVGTDDEEESLILLV